MIAARSGWVSGLGVALVSLALAARAAAEMPAEARAVVEALRLGAAITRDWEAEHRPPAALVEAARRESQLRIIGSWRAADFDKMTGAFRARYPFVRISYTRTGSSSRSRVPLIAFMQGRYMADFLTGIDTDIAGYKKADALESLYDVANRANIPAAFGGAQEYWSNMRIRFYCLSYNTNLVKKQDLPRTWGDLVTAPAFSQGRLGVWYAVGSWLLPIWGRNGDAWTTKFIDDLFVKAAAQKRKEGATSLLSLLAAGEFSGVLATAADNVREFKDRGAPVGLHCADFVLATASSVGILKNAPGRHSAKLFLDWLLSKEGQLAQFHYDGGPPIHKDLQRDEFVPFPEEILGKPVSFRSPELLADGMPRLQKVWQPYWGGNK